MLYLFPRVILYNFFLFLVSGFGFGVLDLALGVGVFSLWSFGPVVWAFWVFWVGALYISIKDLPYEKKVR